MNDNLGTRLLLSRHNVMNQEQLAALAHVRRGYISDLERGKSTNPTIAVVEALARALGVRPEYLAGWSDDPSGEGTTPVQMDPRLQEIVDLFEDLDPAGQVAAREILRTLRSTQHVRVIGS